MADTKTPTEEKGHAIPPGEAAAVGSEAEAIQIEAEAVQAEGALADLYDETESMEEETLEAELPEEDSEPAFEDEPGTEIEPVFEDEPLEASLDEAVAEVEAAELAIETTDDALTAPAPAKKPAKKSPRAKNPGPSI